MSKLELLKTNHDSSLQHKLITILINIYVTHLCTFTCWQQAGVTTPPRRCHCTDSQVTPQVVFESFLVFLVPFLIRTASDSVVHAEASAKVGIGFADDVAASDDGVPGCVMFCCTALLL